MSHITPPAIPKRPKPLSASHSLVYDVSRVAMLYCISCYHEQKMKRASLILIQPILTGLLLPATGVCPH